MKNIQGHVVRMNDIEQHWIAIYRAPPKLFNNGNKIDGPSLW